MIPRTLLTLSPAEGVGGGIPGGRGSSAASATCAGRRPAAASSATSRAAGGLRAEAPHGGIFVFFAISGIVTWLLAIAVGAVVRAAAVIVAEHIGPSGSRGSPRTRRTSPTPTSPRRPPARAVPA